jgi:hypothetical protein
VTVTVTGGRNQTVILTGSQNVLFQVDRYSHLHIIVHGATVSNYLYFSVKRYCWY